MPFPKPFKVKLSPLAENDLTGIAEYTLVNFGEGQMALYTQALYNGMERLADNPNLGQRREDLPEGYKALNVEKHFLIFYITDNIVVISRILHQSRDTKRFFSS